jgi:hypothetical protein
MTSLLQHHGTMDRERGVELLLYLCTKTEYGSLTVPVELDEDEQPVLYRIWRMPAGIWGCWVLFRYHGKENAPDLSVPIRMESLPKGAERLTLDESRKYWKS